MIVKEDGSTETDPNGGDLFWAVRGGGGSFGVVISLTIKMHAQPTQFVQALISWPISHEFNGNVGTRVFNFYNQFVQTMPRQWGGYMILNNVGPVETPVFSYQGSILMSLLFQGEYSDAISSIQPLLDQEADSQLFQLTRNFSTFLEYENTVDDYAPNRMFMVGKLVQPYNLNENFTKLMTEQFLEHSQPFGCTFIHVGGEDLFS